MAVDVLVALLALLVMIGSTAAAGKSSSLHRQSIVDDLIFPDNQQQQQQHHPTADGPGVAHEFLEAHNRVRAKYGVPPLRWSNKLARYARRWSSMRRFDCVMMHSPASPYGENIFWGSGRDWRAADAVSSWASESSYFNWRSQACHPGQVCGHFTQVVWNDTEFVGCGRAECFAGGVFITCSYDPPGNWKGEVPLT